MKKTSMAALAAPAAVLMALAFSPLASAQQNIVPSYSGDAESQLAYQNSMERRQYGHYGAPPWQPYAYGGPQWQRNLPAWQRRGLEAAPRGYRWQRYGDRYALIRRSDGAVVRWR